MTTEELIESAIEHHRWIMVWRYEGQFFVLNQQGALLQVYILRDGTLFAFAGNAVNHLISEGVDHSQSSGAAQRIASVGAAMGARAKYAFGPRLLSFLVSPVIYFMVIPTGFYDLCLFIYQHIS